MTLRRLTVGLVVVCGLGIWGFAHSSEKPSTACEPVLVEDGEGSTHDEGAARYRSNQSRHWRHVAIGNQSSCP